MEDQLLQAALDENTPTERLRELAVSVFKSEVVSFYESTPAERLRELGKIGINPLGKAIAQNPNTPTDILMKLFWHFPIEVLNNPVLDLLLLENPDFLYRLFLVNPKVFSKQDLPKFFNQWAKTHPDANIRTAFLANSTHIPQEWLEEFSDDASSFIRSLVAQKEKAPGHILLKLAEDKCAEVRVTVAKNPNSPTDALKLLANDEIHRIRELVAGHSNTPIHILEKLAINKYEDVRFAIAKNPNTPKYLQEKLANDECKKVRTIAAKKFLKTKSR
jgi:hypothetical protein